MIGVISDIHANYPALEAVLDDMPAAVDTLVCCGDIVGYGPHPVACVRKIRSVADVVVRGNHDRYVVDPRGSFIPGLERIPRYARLALSAADVRWLRDLPRAATVEGYVVVHDWRQWGRLDPILDAVGGRRPAGSDPAGILHGHTHRQGTRDHEGTPLVNPGPVGEPRPSKLLTAPHAASIQPKYAVVDPATDTVTFSRTRYLAPTIRRMVSDRLPRRG